MDNVETAKLELPDLEGLHPESYEEEYKRIMWSIKDTLMWLGEYGLSMKVGSTLSEYNSKAESERHELSRKALGYRKHNNYPAYWETYLKRIPKRGLNNLTKEPDYHKTLSQSDFGSKYGLKTGSDWKGKPTLPDRLRKICVFGLFGVKLPFFYYRGSIMSDDTGSLIEDLPYVQDLTKHILRRLEELYDEMDTVTVLSDSELGYWKKSIRNTIRYIREQGSKWGGMRLLQNVEHKELDSREPPRLATSTIE